MTREEVVQLKEWSEELIRQREDAPTLVKVQPYGRWCQKLVPENVIFLAEKALQAIDGGKCVECGGRTTYHRLCHLCGQ